MNIDYTAITAWAAIVGTFIAIMAIWTESKRARFSQGLDLLFKLIDQFNSEDLKAKRRYVARVLIDDTAERGDKWESAAGEILDHFQLVGILTNRRVLDQELVHSEYFYWLSHYYVYLRSYITEFRQISDSPTTWEDAETLYKELAAIEQKYRPNAVSISPPEASLKEFLESELNL